MRTLRRLVMILFATLLIGGPALEASAARGPFTAQSKGSGKSGSKAGGKYRGGGGAKRGGRARSADPFAAKGAKNKQARAKRSGGSRKTLRPKSLVSKASLATRGVVRPVGGSKAKSGGARRGRSGGARGR